MIDINNIFIGQTAECFHKVTEDDIKKFTELSGDNNRLHVDFEFASKTEFKRPVAHGMLGASFISTLIGTQLPGDGALWFASNIEFLLPVFAGDDLTIRAKVIQIDDRNRIIELQTSIYNQHRQLVTDGTAKVKIVVPPKKIIASPIIDSPGITLVLGGSGMIGKEVCIALALDGHSLAIQYNSNQKKANDAIAQIA
jgi:3-oxoacyl-[acyl-carrier protein] reductase